MTFQISMTAGGFWSIACGRAACARTTCISTSGAGTSHPTELRRWYDHRLDRFEEFARRYENELDEPERSATVSRLRELAYRQQVTLLTATKEIAISSAMVLATVLRGKQP